MPTRTDAINDALERLRAFAYLDEPGFASHGPMGAETLSSLGHDDLVAAWADEYVSRHQPLSPPPVTQSIDLADKAATGAALGDVSRVTDWAITFRQEFAGRPWQDVVRQWAPRLLPGYAGALTHGLIRTSHAVRALAADETPSPLMLDELAHGLALWAASFKVLPGRPRLAGTRSLAEATDRLPRPERPWPLFEAGSFARIDQLEGFPGAVEALGPADVADAGLSALSAQFCRVMLTHPDVIAVPLVHTVTPIAAARILLPYLPDTSAAELFAQLWHVGAAITVAFIPPDSHLLQVEVDASKPDELLGRAVTHRDPHVLKFSEACAREYGLNPDPVYLAAAEHVMGQFPGWAR